MKKYFRANIVLFFAIYLYCYPVLAQTNAGDYQSKFGFGVSLSSVNRYTLTQSIYSSVGGTGYEVGLGVRYWRTGARFLFGHTAMQTPELENLEYNRIHLIGGDLECRLGSKQRWILTAGYHRHVYRYKSKETFLMPGITARSIENEIEQRASLVGAGFQIKPWIRMTAHYEWERIAKENLLGILPSSSYLVFRASFMIDSNYLKERHAAKAQ
jgi:hypothetical protein